MIMTSQFPSRLGAVAGLSVLALAPLVAQAVDWSAVPSYPIVLLYPAQTSFEWSMTPKDHSAAQKFREGKNCKACHIDEEEKYGVPLAEGKRWEPSPIPGKRGAVPVALQFAHDGSNFHLRAQWKDVPASNNPQMDKEFPAKFTMILDDGKVNTFERAGCWAVCHDDQTDMASAKGAERQKYLARSRLKIRRSGGGDATRPQDVLDKMLGAGQFVEYWQAKLKAGAAPAAVDGYILEKRHDNPDGAVSAQAELKDGMWTVTMTRALKAAGAGQKDLEAGNTYTVGFALHEDHADSRFHQVSWEFTMALDGGKADFVADKH
jgi:hypothetical protein